MASLNGPYTLINILGGGDAITGYKLRDKNGVDVVEILNDKSTPIILNETQHDLALAFQASLNNNDVPYLTKIARYFGGKGQTAFMQFAARNVLSILDGITGVDGPTAQLIAGVSVKVQRILDPTTGIAQSLFGPYTRQSRFFRGVAEPSSYFIADSRGIPVSELLNGKVSTISFYGYEAEVANALAGSLSVNDTPYLARLSALGGEVGESALTRALAADAVTSIRAIVADATVTAELEEAAEILLVLA